MIKLSIIIPTFNSNVTLQKAIDSILNTNLNFTYEIIIIDDGSTDSTEEIINKCYNFPIIRYFKHQNGGVSKARNDGILKSQGDYITFLDSDDFFNQKYSNYIKKDVFSYDLIFFNFNIKKNKNHRIAIRNKLDGVYKAKSFLNDLSYFTNETINPVWNKIYKKEIIVNNNIKFKESINIGEDLLFNIDYLYHTENILFISSELITYNIHQNSLVSKFRENRYQIRVELLKSILNFLNRKKIGSKRNNLKIYSKMLIKDFYAFILDFDKNIEMSSKYKKELMMESICLYKKNKIKSSSFSLYDLMGLFINEKCLMCISYISKPLNFFRKRKY
jgi:glycosyltransferase involved in cell wall biosynthesis